MAPPLYTLPKAQRPPHGSLVSATIFCILFNLGIILTNLVQLLAYPLALLGSTQPLYHTIIRGTKASFGQLTIFISQRFAPTAFVVTAGHGMGAPEEWAVRDRKGAVTGIKLPDRGVWMANHQTLCDWMYIWSFAYLTSHSSSILITLKASLRWIPFVGWACQFYGFIFLARNWVADQGPFRAALQRVSASLRGTGGDEKLALLIFPEGTLVTGNTRPKSQKHAETLGVPDMQHTLLPRSTGLFFALRNLAPTLPTLALVDLTIGYPGVRLPNYPEDYYDLSVWTSGLAPPSIHVHVRQWNVLQEVPLGELNGGDGTAEEKRVFDAWLRARWAEKDALMAQFARNGHFAGSGGKTEQEQVVWPLQLRNWWENLAAFSYFAPVFLGWLAGPALWAGLFVLGRKLLGRRNAGGGGVLESSKREL